MFLPIMIFIISSTTNSFASTFDLQDVDKTTKTELTTSSVDANWTVMFYLCCENYISYEAEKKIEDLSFTENTYWDEFLKSYLNI